VTKGAEIRKKRHFLGFHDPFPPSLLFPDSPYPHPIIANWQPLCYITRNFFPGFSGFPMPTYEYQCEKCRKNFELFQSMKDEALATCPKEQCQMKNWGKGKVKRLLGTGAGLIFKGSGFYITDYRSEGYKSAAKSESGSGGSEAKTSSETKETKKAETKPAASSEKPKGKSK
jgi:putative FmdB family regulatory protein